VSVATNTASLPVAWRLYLPEVWANDRAHRREAGAPDEIAFDTKPALALKQIRAAVAVDIPRAPVLADGAYGADTKFREGITELGLLYVVGSDSTTRVPRPRGGSTCLYSQPAATRSFQAVRSKSWRAKYGE
jgi:SRSO17 transposase